jgi:protoporphyrinogen oxidase
MKKIAIIGGGISGVALLRELSNKGVEAHLYEKEASLGGLIRCKKTDGHLYHLLGGHVFNSKSKEVLSWIEAHIPNYKSSLIETERCADILFEHGRVGYPIENHLHELPATLGKAALRDILARSDEAVSAGNFGEFLRLNFGETLYRTYFEPYNRKIWGPDLEAIPLEWLEGKLPMPTKHEILEANVFRQKEEGMVHSTFFYPKENGSQFWVEQLAPDEGIFYNHPVTQLTQIESGEWLVNGSEITYSDIIYTGDVTRLDEVIDSKVADLGLDPKLKKLRARGISNALCRVPRIEPSWTYLPESKLESNRIINTGIFSPSNVAANEHSVVLEFPFGTDRTQMEKDLNVVFPGATIIETNHVKKAYVIQNATTRADISAQKLKFEKHGLHLLGRFAEWEYYNMDMCIKSALDLSKKLLAQSSA